MCCNFAVCLLLCLLKAVSAQYSPIGTLYASSSCTGDSVQLPTTGQYVSNLTSLEFNNRAYSARIRGSWIFYDLENFNLEPSSVRYTHSPMEQCFNFGGLSGITSSVKFAGFSADYRRDTITFFEADWFQAAEEYVSDSIDLALAGNISSIIVTGSSDWTIYNQTHYSGSAICLENVPSPTTDPVFVTDTTELDTPVSHTFIRSVRKGCFIENTVQLKRAPMTETVQIRNMA